MKNRLLKMRVGSRITTKHGFIVRTTKTQWRVVRGTSLSNLRWTTTFVQNESGEFVRI
jgi:hypothetical protein